MTKPRLELIKGYLLSLCFAVLTYLFYVLIVNNDERYFTLPLEIINSSRFVASSTVAPTVTLAVRGSPATLGRISIEDMQVVLDLSDVQNEGLTTKQIELRRSGTLEQTDTLEVSIDPSTIDVVLEPKLTKLIVIEPSFSNSLPRGYLLEDYNVRPSSVEFSGPHSVISDIEAIYTVEIDLGLFNKPTTRTVSLQIPNFTALESLATNEVQVLINVQDVEVVQTFNRIIVEVNNIAPNLQLTNTRNFASLVVQGPQLIIERLTPEIYVDVSAVESSGAYTLDLQTNLPASLETISLEPSELLIELVAATSTVDPSSLVPSTPPNTTANSVPQETVRETPQLTPSPSLAPSSTQDNQTFPDDAVPSDTDGMSDAPLFIPTDE